MVILSAIVVHLLLLGSIFIIYFRSPVITGLQPQLNLKDPPAKRLVLIVTDGLRAESFFHENCTNIPHLREIFQFGLVGISKTQVPTESRPGHIALIAGLYEDPSAVTRGWKANPVEFDTVFNRSDQTYAWGSNDVLGIFSRLSNGRHMHFDAYDDQDFTGSNKTYLQDQWVFERIPLLLRRKQLELKKANRVVFFLHLLGLDTAGHVYKPGTPLFLENLNYTERAIVDTYEIFEKQFPDKRTAYLLTSDHGMTDSGSHGAGDPMETETPFFVWGAGVSNNAPNDGKTFAVGETERLPLHELEQAQLTPLMSALIGLPPPMNNFGSLPIGYLNASKEFEAQAMYSNAQQMLGQYERLYAEHRQGLFSKYLRNFELGIAQINAFKANMEKDLSEQKYYNVVRHSQQIIYEALNGINYYHGYYRNALLLSTCVTYVGWIFYLLQLFVQTDVKRERLKTGGVLQRQKNLLPCSLVAAIILAFVKLQNVSFGVGFYLLLPVPVWFLALHRYSINEIICSVELPRAHLLVLLACIELLVFSFFDRRLISAGYVLYATLHLRFVVKTRTFKIYLWMLLVLVLTIFPILPPVGYQNTSLVGVGILITILRPFVTKARISWQSKICNFVGISNGALCIYLHANWIGVPLLFRIVSWCFLIYSFTSIMLKHVTTLKQRVELIFFNLSSLYVLLCTSYESIFIQLLATELMLTLSTRETNDESLLIDHAERRQKKPRLANSFRLAFCILLYTFFSFFGTGNVASISSFDPNVMRCFLTTFSKTMIMALIVLKLIIPLLLILTIIIGLSRQAQLHERQIFICMLLICDVMGMNFLFFVRNQGSWLEIGSSISHFVIMEITTLVLLLLTYLAKFLLGITSKLK